ncbi:MAG: hypothetical protein H0T84_14955 [Tatlockia sp.]|nr:hypothetical protein [Tatlockia sp.]
MNNSFLDLLVQSENSIIRDEKMRGSLIDFFSYAMETLIHVITLFNIEKKYEQFDPHIGDTACQIRACFIALFAKNTKQLSLVLKRIEEIKHFYNKLSEYKNSMQSNPLHEKNNNYTVRELAERIGVYFYISNEEKILFQSFFLTVFKKETPFKTIVIDFDAISLKVNLSRKVSKKLTRHYQLSIASYSCSEIIRWASLNPQQDLTLLKAVQRFDDDERQVLPCYLFTKIMYFHALEEGISLFLVVEVDGERIPLYFKPNRKRTEFIFSNNFNDDLHKPCITITGHAQACPENYPERFNIVGINTILLSAMAAHPQYSGNKLSDYNQHIFKDFTKDWETTYQPIQNEISYMRLLASTLGCSYENPSLFVVHHIFCATVYTQCLHFKLSIEELTKNNDNIELRAPMKGIDNEAHQWGVLA